MQYLINRTFAKDDAIRVMRKYARGRTVSILARVSLPVDDGSRYFEGASCVTVTKAAAEQYISRVLESFDKRGATINVAVAEHTVIIG